MCNAWNHSASCRCGWGGDGHLGKSGGGFSGVSSVWEHAHTDFCRQTKCPTCGEPVYFVRHNGGSVWFDELGKPWQKHGCFDTPYARHVVKQLTAYARGLSRPLLGVIVETLTFPDHSMKLIVRCVENGQVISAYVKTDTLADRLLGQLVIVSPDENRVMHTALGNVPKEELDAKIALEELLARGMTEAGAKSIIRCYKFDVTGYDRFKNAKHHIAKTNPDVLARERKHLEIVAENERLKLLRENPTYRVSESGRMYDKEKTLRSHVLFEQVGRKVVSAMTRKLDSIFRVIYVDVDGNIKKVRQLSVKESDSDTYVSLTDKAIGRLYAISKRDSAKYGYNGTWVLIKNGIILEVQTVFAIEFLPE